MANFSPGWSWDFTSASWTNLLKKTFAITWRDFQPGPNFSPGWNSEKPHVNALKLQPGLKSELGHAQWLCFQRSKMAVSHFSPQFQISVRAETSHVIATKFQPGKAGWNSSCNRPLRLNFPQIQTPMETRWPIISTELNDSNSLLFLSANFFFQVKSLLT